MLKEVKKSVQSYLVCGLILFFSGFSNKSLSQVDSEFWFVVPELSHRGNTGGTPGTLRIATMELPATVTVSMPANIYNEITNPDGFQEIVVEIPANGTAAVDLTHLIDVAVNPLNNRLENKPLTPNGINNFGLNITSTNMITAFFISSLLFGQIKCFHSVIRSNLSNVTVTLPSREISNDQMGDKWGASKWGSDRYPNGGLSKWGSDRDKLLILSRLYQKAREKVALE